MLAAARLAGVEARIRLVRGDITALDVDAIVNAANPSLLGGGGVDGAIHRAAGPGLLEECRKLGGCPTGEARITGGHRLKARFVIHTVGPVWHGGDRMEAQTLADAYKNTLQLAAANNYRSIAFPAISTGVYGYPKEEAAAIAVRTVTAFLTRYNPLERVLFVCFDEETAAIYRRLLASYP